MTEISFQELIDLTHSHANFADIVFKRLKAYDANSSRRKDGALFPSLKRQMDIFSHQLTYAGTDLFDPSARSGDGKELIFVFDEKGTPIRSTHKHRRITERSYIPHNSKKHGKLMTDREVSGEATVDKIGGPVESEDWSGTKQSCWSIVARLAGELYRLIGQKDDDESASINSQMDIFHSEQKNVSPAGLEGLAKRRSQLKLRLQFLERYAPDYANEIYEDLFHKTNPVWEDMHAEIEKDKAFK